MGVMARKILHDKIYICIYICICISSPRSANVMLSSLAVSPKCIVQSMSSVILPEKWLGLGLQGTTT